MTDAELAEARLSAWRDAERAENKRLRGERAAVVAFLRWGNDTLLDDAADAIERGEHRREEGE